MKTAVVTGASSGIGLAAAQLLKDNGWRVFALSRHCAEGENDGLYGIQCDVTDEKSVFSAAHRITELSAGVDALINCAGMGIAGAVEETADDEMHSQLECNFFGTVRMINAFLPYMRAQGKGHIINISSVGGVFGIPFQAFYSAGKFAIEGMSEALRNEVRPFGIKVCCILPGDTRTGFTACRRYTRATAATAYKSYFCPAINAMTRDELRGGSPDKAAKAILRALNRKNPPVRIVVGASYKLLCFIKRFMPAGVISKALYWMYCTGKPESEYWSFDRDVLKK